MFPIRCFSCGKVIGQFEERIQTLSSEGKTMEEILNILNLDRYCCRRMIMSSVDLSSITMKYKPLPREEKN